LIIFFHLHNPDDAAWTSIAVLSKEFWEADVWRGVAGRMDEEFDAVLGPHRPSPPVRKAEAFGYLRHGRRMVTRRQPARDLVERGITLRPSFQEQIMKSTYMLSAAALKRRLAG
jgi:hypothetical protein